MIRLLALWALVLGLAGCGLDRQPEAPLHVHTHANEAGELWVRVNNGEPLRLLGGARGYRPLLSPDGAWLAVEVRPMSDLEVVRVFRRDGTRFEAAGEDVTAIAWRRAAADGDLKLDELERPSARVAGWGDDGASLELELSAGVPDKNAAVEATVVVPLRLR